MVAAGVLVGIVAGAMLFSDGGQDAPEQTAQAPAETRPAETAANTPDVKPETAKVSEQATAQQTPPPAASPVALVYIRILDGETLKVNGEPKALRPANNGYASLKLPAGETKIELQGNGRTRSQTLDIAKPGTWLVNP